MAKQEKAVKKVDPMVKVIYLKDHGTRKAGADTMYHITTARALAAAKVVKIEGEANPTKEEAKPTTEDTKDK